MLLLVRSPSDEVDINLEERVCRYIKNRFVMTDFTAAFKFWTLGCGLYLKVIRMWIVFYFRRK